MKVKKSDIQLLIGAIGVLLAVCTYFFVYAKFNEKSDALETENATLQSRVATLEILDQKKADYATATENMKQYITGFENRFPAGILPEDSIMNILHLEESTNTKVASLGFGTDTEVPYVAAQTADAAAATTADAATTDATAAGTTDTTAANGPISTEGTAYADTHMYEVPLSFSIECTYNDFKGLVRYIYNLQERESIRGVSLSYSTETGALSGNMTMSTYYLQGTDKVYSEPVIPNMEMGVDTIFGNLGENASADAENTQTAE